MTVFMNCHNLENSGTLHNMTQGKIWLQVHCAYLSHQSKYVLYICDTGNGFKEKNSLLGIFYKPENYILL